MESAPLPPPAADEYFVLERGNWIGPMTLEGLRAAVQSERFDARDLVQHGNAPIWRRAGALIAADGVVEVAMPEPGWRAILTAAGARLWRDVQTASLATAGVFFVCGLAVWLLAQWPPLLWLPWFLPPVAAGVLALTRGKLSRGLLLLLTVAVVPAVAAFLKPRAERPAPAPEPLPAQQSAATPVVVAPPAQPAAPAAVVEPTPGETAPPPLPPAPEPEPVVASVRPVKLPPEKPLALKPPPAPLPPNSPPGELVRHYRDAFVLVQSGEGHGSGFICRLEGRLWLLTNNHVLAGMRAPQFTQLNGTRIAVGAADSAAGCDLLRLAVPNPPPAPLEALTDLEAHARIGDEVVVLGNTGGGGVVTSLEGKLVGIGPDRVEVSAEFIPGNSGSPIVHVKSGKVIGIATYLTRRYEEFAGPSRGPRNGEVVVRRFGFRLDMTKKWEPVNWTVFQSEAQQLQKISALTGDVFDFLGALRENREPEFSTDTLRRPATEWVKKVGKGGMSDADRRSATQGFLGALRLMVRADVVAAESGLRYTYFRDELKKEREIRDRLFKAFDDEVKRMSSPAGRAEF